MAIELPYLATYKNVPLLFENIAKTKVPDAFTNNFLSGTLGLKSTNDRALITFGALTKLADFSGSSEPVTPSSENGGKEEPKVDAVFTPPNPATVHMAKFEPEFRFDIEVHLPSNGTEETYLNIFSALRKVLA